MDRMSNLGANLHAVNWDQVQVVQSEWNFYKPSRQRSDAEVAEWLHKHHVTIYGDRVPQPMFEFSDLVAPDCIHQAFMDQKYVAPTAIQSIAWPILLNSRDLVGIAKTGSGKTFAFMVPAALHIMAQPPLRPGDGPIALVVSPTRELAVQIEEETRKLLRRLPHIQTTCLYGGAPKGGQLRALRAGVHVVIATPGRLIDMLEMQATNLLRVTYLVLDEADRCLDMGFEPQIRKICSQIRQDRQTLMFSATWPQEVRNLAATFQRDFVRVHVGSEDLVANNDVRQHIIAVDERDKMNKAAEVLRAVGRQRALIFTKTKRMADDLHNFLGRQFGSCVLVIHGDKEQGHRDRVLDRFRHDPHAILVATDVAARGLDIKDLDVVLNFDFPMSIEDYVHRIGRTGRAGKSGDAYSFVCSSDTTKVLRDLVDVLQRARQTVPQELWDVIRMPRSSSSSFRSRGPPPSSYAPSPYAPSSYAAPTARMPYMTPPTQQGMYNSSSQFNQAALMHFASQNAGSTVPPPSDVGAKRPRESFNAYDGDDRRYRRDSRERRDSRDRRRSDSRDRRRRSDSRDRRR